MHADLNKKDIHWADARVLLIVFNVGSFCLGKKSETKTVLFDQRTNAHRIFSINCQERALEPILDTAAASIG